MLHLAILLLPFDIAPLSQPQMSLLTTLPLFIIKPIYVNPPSARNAGAPTNKLINENQGGHKKKGFINERTEIH